MTLQRHNQSTIILPTGAWAYSAADIITLLETFQGTVSKQVTVLLVETDGMWKAVGSAPQVVEDLRKKKTALVQQVQVQGLFGASNLVWNSQGQFNITGPRSAQIVQILESEGYFKGTFRRKDLAKEYDRIHAQLMDVSRRIQGKIEPSLKQQEQLLQKHSQLDEQIAEIPARLDSLHAEARKLLSFAQKTETSLLKKETGAGSIFRDIEGIKARVEPYRERLSKLGDELIEEVEVAKSQVQTYSQEHKQTIKRLEEVAQKVTSEQLRESFNVARQQVGFNWLIAAIIVVNLLAFGWIAYITIVFSPSGENAFSALALRAVAVVIVLPVDFYLLRELSAARREAQTYRFKQAVLSSLPEYRRMLEKVEDSEVKDFSLKVMERVYRNPASNGNEDQLTPMLEKILEPNGPLSLKPADEKKVKKAEG